MLAARALALDGRTPAAMANWIDFPTLCNVRCLTHIYYALALLLFPKDTARAWAPFENAADSAVIRLGVSTRATLLGSAVSLALAAACFACAASGSDRAVSFMAAYQTTIVAAVAAAHVMVLLPRPLCSSRQALTLSPPARRHLRLAGCRKSRRRVRVRGRVLRLRRRPPAFGRRPQARGGAEAAVGSAVRPAVEQVTLSNRLPFVQLLRVSARARRALCRASVWRVSRLHTAIYPAVDTSPSSI